MMVQDEGLFKEVRGHAWCRRNPDHALIQLLPLGMVSRLGGGWGGGFL